MEAFITIVRKLRWIKTTSIWLPLIITLLSILICVKNPPVIDGYIEALLVDYRFKIRNVFSSQSIPDNILIVAIDEKSLSEYGRWPWGRKLQAKLIDKIFAGQPKVVAVDIFYPESESPEADRMLADIFRAHKDKLVVALGFDVKRTKSFDTTIEDILYENTILNIKNRLEVRPPEAYRVFLPREPLAGASVFGHVYSLADRDGKLRWENAYIKYGDEYFPSLAIQTARIAMGIPHESVHIAGGAGLVLGNLLVPTDEFGRLHINYMAREGSILHKSAADVLSDKLPKGIFKNKIILIGTTAIATYDLKNTPFSANMSGVEKNATVVANILNRDFIKRSSLLVDLLIILLFGLLIIFICNKLHALPAVVTFFFLITLLLIFNLALFIYFGIRTNLTYPLINTIAAGMFIISHKYFIEEKKSKNIRKMFSTYVSEKVVNELIKNPDMAKLGGDRREITILFSDVIGFTTFSEKYAPEQVVVILNEYLKEMTEIIFKWEGTLDKFIGDAILAFWGAPLQQEKQAELAVRCALDMVTRLEVLQQRWKAEGKPAFDCGIGINTGEVLVGNIGAEGKKMDYTVIGDHVNLCSRIEELTREYNARILITEFTLDKIRKLVEEGVIGHISINDFKQVIVRGRGKPVKIYKVLPAKDGENSKIMEHEEQETLALN